jgi:dual oxidase
MYEYLPALIGESVGEYEGYKADVHPGISHVFQSAAFRFGHTMIPPGLYRRDGQCNFKLGPNETPAIRLCSAWWDAVEILVNNSVEEFILGMASQLAEREDSVLCSDVRNKLFGPMEFSRRDLGAINIMRGRDTGLPDYNTARRSFRLSPITNWTDINPALAVQQPDLFPKLAELYGNDLGNVDVYIGGMLESTNGPGPLFTAVIKEQLGRIRDADRFWFENSDNGMFTASEIEEIRKTTFFDVIRSTMNISEGEIQRNVFFFRDGDPCPQPTQLNASELTPCNFLAGYDYFAGSEVPYIYGCLLLAFVPIVAAGAGYGVVKLQNSKRRRLKARHEENNNGKSVDKMVVKEWLHLNHKRLVKVKFGPEEAFYTVNRKGEKLRKVNFKGVELLTVEVTQDARKKPMLLVRVPRDYDLVLEFDSNASRKRFLHKLETFLTSHKKHLEQIPTYREQMLSNAETRERREKRLEHFFREAYALTFGLKPGEKRKMEEVTGDVIMVMRTSLSRSEFASALGMKGDDVFVKMMFNIVDKDGDGRISFQEFLDTVVLFSKGRTEDKLHIIFDMCDNDRNGVIDKGKILIISMFFFFLGIHPFINTSDIIFSLQVSFPRCCVHWWKLRVRTTV